MTDRQNQEKSAGRGVL